MQSIFDESFMNINIEDHWLLVGTKNNVDLQNETSLHPFQIGDRLRENIASFSFF